MERLDEALVRFFAKLPQASQRFRDGAARWYPTFLIVIDSLALLTWLFGVIAIAALGALTSGLGGKPTPFISALGPVLLVLIPVACITGIAAGVLMRQRNPLGFKLALIATLANSVMSLLDLSVFSLLLNAFALWLLYQIRDHFVGDEPVATRYEPAPIAGPEGDAPAMSVVQSTDSPSSRPRAARRAARKTARRAKRTTRSRRTKRSA